MRIGRIHNVTRGQRVSLDDAYPRIMELFSEAEGVADVLSYMEDGCGDYIAHLNICGINVIYCRDEYGFESLQTMSDDELAELQKQIDADYDASV
jgi:hypothetical protein